MSETKFTPGPWFWQTSCSWRRLGTHEGDGIVLCPVKDRSDGHPNLYFKNGGDEGPDANLIAEAPALYGALERLIAAFDDAEVAELTAEQRSALDAGDAALAKARGETP